jgi:DNA-binding NarL/FixJ family response regulator
MTLKLLIVDDHAFTLEGMQHALSNAPAMQVCATASGGVLAIAAARLHRPDVAVLDYTMPDASGLEVAGEIRRWSPTTRCMIVTGSTAPLTLAMLVASGIGGVFTKTCPIDEVIAAIPRVARGERVISALVGALLGEGAAHDAPALSDRERQVLDRIARGLTNARIGDELSISPKTVESHRASLMRKLDVNSPAALVVAAIRRGLLLP